MAPALMLIAAGVTPILHLEGDDVVWSGNSLSSWPAVIGSTVTVATDRSAPVQGDLANKHRSVRFSGQTNGTLLNAGSIQASASDYTIQLAWTSNSLDPGLTCREYVLRSYAVIDEDDVIIAHAANLLSHKFTGFFDGAEGADTSPGGGWHYFKRTNWAGNTTKVRPATILRVDTYVLTSGASKLYRNGVMEGSATQYTQRRMTDLHIGGTKDAAIHVGDPNCTGFDGQIFQIKIWNQALPDADVLQEQYASMQRFGASVWPPVMDDPIDIFGASLIAWYDLGDPFYLEYEDDLDLIGWANRVNSATHSLTVSSTKPVIDAEAFGKRPSQQVGRIGAGASSWRADTVATSTYPTTGTTIFAVFSSRTGNGETSTAGAIAAFGADADGAPRNELQVRLRTGTGETFSAADDYTRSWSLDNASGFHVATSAGPGTGPHFVIATTNETTGVSTVDIDGTVTTGSASVLGTQTLSTFGIGTIPGFGNDGWLDINLSSVGVVNRVLTASEKTALRLWAHLTWQTP